ncbi:hypothetical protein D3C85_1184210 [compost metagenome]
MERVQQQCAARLGILRNFEDCDELFGLTVRVLELDLLAWPCSVRTYTMRDPAIQWLTSLYTTHDDGVVAFKTLTQPPIVATRAMQIEQAGRLGSYTHRRVAVDPCSGLIPSLSL